jgi:putative drug exporter of the RND superfamily
LTNSSIVFSLLPTFPVTRSETAVLARLARFCYRRRWIVLAVWVVALVGTNMASSALGDGFSQRFNLPASDSQKAMELLGGLGDGASGDIVFKADAGLADPAARARLDTLVSQIKAVPGVKEVETPFDPTPLAASKASPDGRIGYISVNLGNEFPLPEAMTTGVDRAVEAARAPGLQVELGGAFGAEGPGNTSELIAVGAAFVILIIAFGSLLAMGLPLLTALFGLGVGMASVGLISHLLSVPEFTTQLAAMIGLGVGIDYALFIVTRYRQGLADGLEPEAAVVKAIDTAGRAVLFAGTTVVISMGGMLLMGIEFIAGLGLGAAAVVAVTVAISVTLLPAILGFTGRNIDKLSVPGLGRNAHGSREGMWFKWSRFLQRRPWPFALAGLLLLVALSVPVLALRLGTSDNSSLPTSSTVRRAYDLKVEAFGAGANTTVVLVAKIPEGTTAAQLAPISQAVAAQPNVAAALPLFPLPTNPGVAAAMIRPKTSVQDEATQQMIVDLRDNVLPPVVAQVPGVEVHLGGETAIMDDLAALLQSRLPVFIGVVLGLSFLLLLVVFRSIVVPLKAVIMNLLSIGAAYGIVVAVFQWGWGASLFGVGNKGPIESFVPMMMFAILFGLSMDYEVFLLSRIKEEHDRTGDNGLAVADGLSATARVITAAALIMVMVFGAFVLGDQRVIKEFGLGLAVAILIDASIVRMVLVPATMELLGNANWWFPTWLSWLPVIHVEGGAEDDGSFDAELEEVLHQEKVGRT